jgi:hypothetical protein
VSSVNDAPVANNDSATTNEDTAVTRTVTSNDTDLDGDTLTVTGATLTSGQGTVAFSGGNVTFTPAANFNGTATIGYTISDGNGGTASAVLTVTVTAVNDPPIAANDAATTNEDTAVACPCSRMTAMSMAMCSRLRASRSRAAQETWRSAAPLSFSPRRPTLRGRRPLPTRSRRQWRDSVGERIGQRDRGERCAAGGKRQRDHE